MGKVNLIGFEALQKRIKEAPAKLKKEIRAEIQFGAEDFRTRAIKDAPADTGNLRRHITAKHEDLSSEVVSGANYSAYLEFGTITKVYVPPGLEDFASQFKGRGIRTTGGISPRPFFFKQIEPVRNQLIKNIENVLKDIL